MSQVTFTVEVLLKGEQHVVEEVVHREGRAPAAWTEEDARDVLRLILECFDRVLNPGGATRTVELRGLSWIVTAAPQGVVIAIEIPSGAVVAGPFDAEVGPLTELVRRTLKAAPAPTIQTVH